MANAAGVRIGWVSLPEHVRRAVERILGEPVVAVVSQVGGFSPGTADRVRTASGRRAFVKAVSAAQNEYSPRLHRAEAAVTAALPAGLPVPRLLGAHDDGEWVALVLSDVDGRHPATPWQRDELKLVLETLDTLAELATPCPVPALPPAATLVGEDFAGWHRIREDPPRTLDPWAAAHLDELCDLSDQGVAALSGDTLVHLDMRADNLLITRDGSVTLVDWPWACVGPAWLDTVLLLVNVRLHGGHDTTALLASRGGGAEQVGVLAGFGGFLADMARRSPPPGLPTVRAFQQAQADAVLSWLAELTPAG